MEEIITEFRDFDSERERESCEFFFFRRIGAAIESEASLAGAVRTHQHYLLSTERARGETMEERQKYFFSPQGPQNRVLNFEMMP